MPNLRPREVRERERDPATPRNSGVGGGATTTDDHDDRDEAGGGGDGASPCPPSLILAATAEKLRPRSGRGRDAAPASLYCDRRLPRTPLFSIGVAQPRGGRCTEATLKRGVQGVSAGGPRGVQSVHCSAWWRGDTRAAPTGRANIDEGGSGGSQAFKSRPEYRGTLGVDLALTRWQCPHPETPTPPPQPARQRTR